MNKGKKHAYGEYPNYHLVSGALIYPIIQRS